jgi:hypothetical protein
MLETWVMAGAGRDLRMPRPDGGSWQTQGRHCGTAFRLANGRFSVEGTSATGLDQASLRPNYGTVRFDE